MLAFKKAKRTDFQIGLEMLKSAALINKERGIAHWQYWLEPPPMKKDWLIEGFKNQEFYFIYSEDKRMGMFRLMEEDLLYWGKEDKPAFYLHSLVILPEFRGRDYGQQTLDMIESHCREKEKYHFRLDCSTDNPRLCKYYEDQGFQFVRKVELNGQFNNLYEKLLI